jgi:hypothetical protein
LAQRHRGEDVPAASATALATSAFSVKLLFNSWRSRMDAVIYLVGLVVIVMAILSFFGLR